MAISDFLPYRADKLGDGRTDGLTDRRRQRQYPQAKITSGKNDISSISSCTIALHCSHAVAIPSSISPTCQELFNANAVEIWTKLHRRVMWWILVYFADFDLDKAISPTCQELFNAKAVEIWTKLHRRVMWWILVYYTDFYLDKALLFSTIS